MTSETTPVEAAPAQPTLGAPHSDATGLTTPNPGGPHLTRAQWRRMAAEAELAAKVAAATHSTELATADEGAPPIELTADASTDAVNAASLETVPADLEIADSDRPLATEGSGDDTAGTHDDMVLTVVDGDAGAGASFAAPERRRRSRAAETSAAAPGESFGPAAVDDGAETAGSGEPEYAADPDGASFAESADQRFIDEFEFAARLFSFTAQTPVQVVGQHLDTGEQPRLVVTAPRRRVRRIAKRMAAASLSLGAVAAVGLLAVGLTSPAAAVLASGDTGRDISAEAPQTAATVEPDEIQAYVSSSTPGVSLDRSDDFDVTSVSQIAADSGVTIFAGTWVNDPNAAIQWPFPVGVPISAAFGSSSYLSQFSRPHSGTDLTPGVGADIHAVAAGTVRIATEAGGDYGVTVVIDHVIDGELVSTRYGHMQYGSLEVEVGDTVQPGQVIGTVGSTGKSTGPHLHLEVLLGGTTQTDPMAWLQEHTAG